MIEIKLTTEFKAIFIIIFAIFGFTVINPSRVFYFTIISSLILVLISSYIYHNELILSKAILNLSLAFFNVTSLAFMVQYFMNQKMDMKIYSLIFKPFMTENSYKLGYILWIFVFSLFLTIYQTQGNRNPGEKYGR